MIYILFQISTHLEKDSHMKEKCEMKGNAVNVLF